MTRTREGGVLVNFLVFKVGRQLVLVVFHVLRMKEKRPQDVQVRVLQSIHPSSQLPPARTNACSICNDSTSSATSCPADEAPACRTMVPRARIPATHVVFILQAILFRLTVLRLKHVEVHLLLPLGDRGWWGLAPPSSGPRHSAPKHPDSQHVHAMRLSRLKFYNYAPGTQFHVLRSVCMAPLGALRPRHWGSCARPMPGGKRPYEQKKSTPQRPTAPGEQPILLRMTSPSLRLNKARKRSAGSLHAQLGPVARAGMALNGTSG